MARTTQEAVEEIIDNDEAKDLTPFIETANALVEEKLATVTRSDGTLYHDDIRLELIERWLSAYYFALHSPRSVSEQAGPVLERTESKAELGFDLNKYGRAAMQLDTSGTLAMLNQQNNKGQGPGGARLVWLGTEYE